MANAFQRPGVNRNGAWQDAQGQIDPYNALTRWIGGTATGMVAPGGEQPASAEDLAQFSDVNAQYPEGFWGNLGFNGTTTRPQYSGGENRENPVVSDELRRWLSDNGYQAGYTDGYGGVLDRSGRPVPGSAFGNRTNDDATFIAGMLGIGGFGIAANAAGLGVDAAGNATGGAFGPAGGTGTGAGSGVDYGLTDLPAQAGDPTRAALYGDAGYGAGMTGGETAAYDTALKAAGGGASSSGSSLGDFFSGNGNVSDYGRLAQGLIGLYTGNRATNAAQQGAQDQNALIREAMAKNQPLIDTRDAALGKLNGLMADPSSITKDPGYQFWLNQGQSQIDNQQAARGGYYSGQQLKASQKFGQDYAGTKLDQSYNRLLGVAGMGQIGGTQNGNLSLNLGQGLANAGNIRGSGYIGMGNTAGNAVGDWTNDWINRKTWGG